MPRSSEMARAGKNIVLSRSVIARMKASAVIETPEMKKAMQKAAEDERKLRMAKSENRKKQMKEKEFQAKMRAPETEEQLYEECRRLAYAEPLTDQEREHDTAKRMYSVQARAAAFKKREEQKLEKIAAAAAEQKYHDYWNRQMEADRIKDVNARAMFEQEKRIRNKAFQTQLKAQIAENVHRSLMEKEEQELEKKAQLKKLQKNQEDEIARMQAAHALRIKQAKDVALSNDQAKEMRLKQEAAEKMSDQMIVEYQKMKIAQEAKLEADYKEKKRLDELRTAKLRAQQEKQSDTQAEEDEARAMRATEAKERKARRQEELERQKIARVNDQMRRDKEEARQERIKLQQRQAREVEREVREIKYQQGMAAKEEVRKAQIKKAAAYSNSRLVKAQMAQNEGLRLAAKEIKKKEARDQKISFNIERIKLDRVKQETTKAMAAQGHDISDVTRVQCGY